MSNSPQPCPHGGIMKKLLRDAAIFILCFAVIFQFFDRLTFDPAGTSQVWKYIQSEDPEPIDILFMGNSHAYCGINPFIINQAMDLNTMILATGYQPMDQTYENLKILLHYVHPKVIVLESNVLVLTTDKAYEANREGVLYNNFDSIENPIYRAAAIINTINQHNRWPEAFSQLLRPTNTWTRFGNHAPGTSDNGSDYNATLGFYPQNQIYKETNAEPAEIERLLIEGSDESIPLKYPGAMDALKKFLALASKEGIPVYIIKTPTMNLNLELTKVADLLQVMEVTEPALTGYRNFSEQMTKIGIESDDFSDEGHLNREGANKFTICIMEWLSGELGIPFDLSKATGVREESFEKLPKGKYRYTVSLLDNTLIKFIVKDGHGNVTYETEYSDVNYIDMLRISASRKLYYRICSKTEIPGREYPFEQEEYLFMHDE